MRRNIEGPIFTSAALAGRFEAIVGKKLKLRVQEPQAPGRLFWVRTAQPIEGINPSGIRLNGNVTIPLDDLMKGLYENKEVRIGRFPSGRIVAVGSLLGQANIGNGEGY